MVFGAFAAKRFWVYFLRSEALLEAREEMADRRRTVAVLGGVAGGCRGASLPAEQRAPWSHPTHRRRWRRRGGGNGGHGNGERNASLAEGELGARVCGVGPDCRDDRRSELGARGLGEVLGQLVRIQGDAVVPPTVAPSAL